MGSDQDGAIFVCIMYGASLYYGYGNGLLALVIVTTMTTPGLKNHAVFYRKHNDYIFTVIV